MDSSSRRWLNAGFAISAVVGTAFFFIPAFIIRPFRYQSRGGLILAMSLRQHAPLVTAVCAMMCFLLTLPLWPGPGRWRKAGLAAALVLVSFSAVMARMNYFEWMFHPVDGPQFLTQAQAKLDGKEMVMAVRLGDDARAYPISQMAYHHVLNDVVGDKAIVVTY